MPTRPFTIHGRNSPSKGEGKSREHLFDRLGTHLPEPIHNARVDNEQDTTTGTQSENLGDEALVQRTEAFLLHDRAEAGPRPVVFGGLAGDLGGVLYPTLDDVHGSVEDGSDGAADGARDEVDQHGFGGLDLLVERGQELFDLEDAAKVAGVPEDVAP